MHPAAEAEFFFVKADKVMLGCILHGVVILKISLQYHLAGRFAASGASGDLRQQLKCSLRCAKVRQAERAVRSHDSNQGDAVNVVTLGDHLRADEKIDFPRVHPGQHAFEVIAPAHRVAIDARDPRLRKIPCSNSSNFSDPVPRK